MTRAHVRAMPRTAFPHVFVLGASAGGVEALMRLLRALGTPIPAALLIAIHTSPTTPSQLPQLISNVDRFRARHPSDWEPIERGMIYIAPSDHHMLLKRSGIRLVQGPKERGFRPAIDPLFRTAARAYGPRVVGIILSGARDDGSVGFEAIKTHGGTTIAQSPEEAAIPSMPLSAIRSANVDHVLAIADIAKTMRGMADEGAKMMRGPLPEEDSDVLELQ